MNYKIIQKINTTSTFPNIYKTDEYKLSEIYIAENIEGKQGIVTKEDEFILPFEYDKITLIGFGTFQLSQCNKLGLAIISKDILDECSNFIIKDIIPCEYDYIKYPDKLYDSIIYLYRYNETGRRCQVYLRNKQELTRECYEAYASCSDLVVLTDKRASEIININTGESLYTCKKEAFCVTSYETKENVVICLTYYDYDIRTHIVLFEKLFMDIIEGMDYFDFANYIILNNYKTIDLMVSTVIPILDYEKSYFNRQPIEGFYLDEHGCYELDKKIVLI